MRQSTGKRKDMKFAPGCDRQEGEPSPIPTRHIVCCKDDPSADAALELPGFFTPGGAGLAFATMSDAQLEAYRDIFARASMLRSSPSTLT